MVKRYLLLAFSITALHLLSVGQNTEINTYDADTAHINSCIELCSNIIFTYPDSTQKYVDTILSTSQNSKYEHGLLMAYNFQGLLFWMSNDMDLALEQFKLALRYSNTPKSPRRKAVVLSNIGLIYTNLFNLDSAKSYLDQTIQYSKEYNIVDMHNKALFDLSNIYLEQDNYIEAVRNLLHVKDELEINTDSLLLMYVYSNFGILYSKVNKFDMSLLFYQKAIELDKMISGVSHIANNYINIGELYFNSEENMDSAANYYRKAIAFALPHNKRNVEMAANINLANVYLYKMQLDSAKAYYENALADSLIKKFLNREAAVLVNLGLYYLEKQDLVNAQLFLRQGYDIAEELDILRYQKHALEALCRLDSIAGDYKQFASKYKLYHVISDRLQASIVSNEIATLEFNKFIEQEKYSNKILMKENKLKSKLIWITLIALFILLGLLTILFLNRKKIKGLLEQLSEKHKNQQLLNEELATTNEVLHTQQEELKALNNTKDKFFSILGHDLKSPFNGLLGLLDLIDKEWENLSDDKKRSLIQSLFASSKKTYQLLEDLLNWGKAQQGLIKYTPETFLLYYKIKDVTDLFEAQLNNKAQQLVIDVSPELELNTDILLFSQIVQNLVNNAIKYTHHGGVVTVKVETSKNELKLCVIDTGIGIPANKISTLFDLDSDFNRPGTENEKSTGMGLILSKEYAELINAKLTISSTEGKGSSFCLTLPVSSHQKRL